MKALLATHSLSIGYKHTTILKDINISIFPAEVVSLLGSNGIGKSTLLKSLTGEIDAISGSVEIDNTPLKNLSNKALSQLIAIVTTERVQAGGLKVEELVSLGRHPHTGFFGKLSQKDKQIAMEAMQSVGIYHKKDSFTSELSDGERQKMMIARAIAQQTPIIILDEPFSFLDTASRIEIFPWPSGRPSWEGGSGSCSGWWCPAPLASSCPMIPWRKSFPPSICPESSSVRYAPWPMARSC